MANIVPGKKKNGQIRFCVNFQDLDKACLKDEFPLCSRDIFIDSTFGQRLLLFMDGFNGYNQIKMTLKDVEKTIFNIPAVNFYYTFIPFVLTNVRAIYKKVMTTGIHDMMGKEVGDYVDDILVKSPTRDTQ